MPSWPLRHVVTPALLTLLVCPSQSLGQARDTVDVLFIGNSYVYYNNLADQLEGIALALDGGPVVEADHHLHGGFSLRGHLDDGHVPALLSHPAPDGRPWDRVILQEHSRLGVPYADPSTGALGDREPFHAAARSLVSQIRASGSSALFYMTWAKEAFPGQILGLADAYEDIGRELGVPVAPAGLAWDRVRGERPDLDLFTDDGSHPNPVGTYLVACVMYATLTGRSPAGAPTELFGLAMTTPGVLVSDEPVRLLSLDAPTAAYLQRVAWETVSTAAAGAGDARRDARSPSQDGAPDGIEE